MEGHQREGEGEAHGTPAHPQLHVDAEEEQVHLDRDNSKSLQSYHFAPNFRIALCFAMILRKSDSVNERQSNIVIFDNGRGRRISQLSPNVSLPWFAPRLNIEAPKSGVLPFRRPQTPLRIDATICET